MFQRLKPAGGRFDNEGQGAVGAPISVSARPAAATLPPGAASALRATGQGANAVESAILPAGSPAVISWAAPSTVKAGEVFDVQLQLRTGISLGTLALSIRYPNTILGLVGFSNSLVLWTCSVSFRTRTPAR
jgi:hypothetical protein